jgi:hypothetical protein
VTLKIIPKAGSYFGAGKFKRPFRKFEKESEEMGIRKLLLQLANI